mgnify:CR=1 FL=1
MQEPLQKPAFSKQALLHCAGIVGAGLLYSLGINLFVVPTGLYTGGIMGFAQLLRTLFLHLTGLELKIDIAGIINYAINLPILCIAWKQLDHRVVFKTLLSVTSTTVFMSLIPRTDILHGDQLAECLIGGILCGCGIGITLWMGGTTGGMDVIGMMLIKKGSHTSIGHVNLFWNMALYAICRRVQPVHGDLFDPVLVHLHDGNGQAAYAEHQRRGHGRDQDPEPGDGARNSRRPPPRHYAL